jgi:hypothetical protein
MNRLRLEVSVDPGTTWVRPEKLTTRSVSCYARPNRMPPDTSTAPKRRATYTEPSR